MHGRFWGRSLQEEGTAAAKTQGKNELDVFKELRETSVARMWGAREKQRLRRRLAECRSCWLWYGEGWQGNQGGNRKAC